ncbi:MAG TPA: hypothetical protein VF832_08800 [Longimicrobiales bacterium]
MTGTPFQGGGTALRNALVLAALGLGLTAVGALVDLTAALQSYHVAFTYWAGIAVGALLVNMAFQAGKAKWHTVLKRVLESIPLAQPLLLVLAIPVLLGMVRLFPWVNPAALDEEVRALAEHRQGWLNPPFFVVRTLAYFALWIAVGHLLWRWSVRQDAEGGAALTAAQRRLGAGALPFVGLAMTFAAFDWQMSLDLRLSSTIFGLYWFAGSFLSAFAVVILAVNAARGVEGSPGALMNANHYHSLGKYLLAFVAFWAYMAFSQYLLIWIANLPEEVPWYLARNQGGWLPVGVILVLFHFVVPFFVLLSRRLKRSPRGLGFMAVWILVIHYVDVYWVMMPALRHDPAHAFQARWTDLPALVGIGAACVAFVLWRMRGRAVVPVGDPFLAESLRYDPS